jgi:hypothetical protein
VRYRRRVTRDKAQVGLALGALFVAVVACKYSYTPPGTRDASSDASIDAPVDAGVDEDALAEEDPPDADKRCYTSSAKTACLRGKKAKVCAATGKGRNVGEWRVFGCPDCSTEGYAVTCSDLVPGDYCSVGSARAVCTKDKLAVYTCDYPAHEWKIQACPGGCVPNGAFDPRCNQ